MWVKLQIVEVIVSFNYIITELLWFLSKSKVHFPKSKSLPVKNFESPKSKVQNFLSQPASGLCIPTGKKIKGRSFLDVQTLIKEVEGPHFNMLEIL